MNIGPFALAFSRLAAAEEARLGKETPAARASQRGGTSEQKHNRETLLKTQRDFSLSLSHPWFAHCEARSEACQDTTPKSRSRDANLGKRKPGPHELTQFRIGGKRGGPISTLVHCSKTPAISHDAGAHGGSGEHCQSEKS